MSSCLTTYYYKGFSGHEIEMEHDREVLKEAKVIKTMKIIVESHLDSKMKLRVHKKLKKLQRRLCTRQIQFDMYNHSKAIPKNKMGKRKNQL